LTNVNIYVHYPIITISLIDKNRLGLLVFIVLQSITMILRMIHIYCEYII